MKVRSEQLEQLLQIQNQIGHGTKVNQATSDFGAIFSEELSAENASSVESVQTPKGIDPLLLLGNSTDASQMLLDDTVAQASMLLESFEDYSNGLNNPQMDMRSMWSSLTQMESDLSNLKANMQKLGSQGAGLEDIVNELEILTSTEKIKINRGDYL